MLSNCVIAQENYSYKIEYDMMLNFDGYKKYSAYLFFNLNCSNFTYQINDNIDENVAFNQDDETLISFIVSDYSQYFIKSSKCDDLILQLEKGFKNEKYYLVKEKLPEIDWTITEDTKAIGSHICYKANGNFAGRNYNAWFTTEISGFFGPWKFHGLPGIVLEISDQKNEVQFFATKISTVNIPLNIVDKTSDYSVVPRDEYILRLNKYVDDLGKKIKSKISRGFNVKMQRPKIKTIEIYED
tara:strand:+ start:2643 stop:3368 length:726 start_codon:yes stop_codon:yes gene_type:complete